ncbi:hypothetical protein TWF506_006632 [Arthrobotrys conoides]|uniref:Nucleoside phosphorylase domain-containing protein n=1 Tax=Arthrobotrys conoides TaxID=74498 RepID=A0AAN8NMC2_9PEZI
METLNTDICPNDYRVGWVCALQKERAALSFMLDVRHTADIPITEHDTNNYTLGSIGGYNVAITCLKTGSYGTNQMAIAVTHMKHTFPFIKHIFVVGIGAGIPASNVRLGDVVISEQWRQWDFGAEGSVYQPRSKPLEPSKVLAGAIQNLRTDIDMFGMKLAPQLKALRSKYRKLPSNFFFVNTYDKVTGEKITINKPSKAKVHYGLIASGNSVIKNAQKRDDINKHLGNKVLCIEMEAAGVVECDAVVIRGICDLADEQKNDDWQEYAAMVAAICARDLLKRLQSSFNSTIQVEETRRLVAQDIDDILQLSDKRSQIRIRARNKRETTPSVPKSEDSNGSHTTSNEPIPNLPNIFGSGIPNGGMNFGDNLGAGVILQRQQGSEFDRFLNSIMQAQPLSPGGVSTPIYGSGSPYISSGPMGASLPSVPSGPVGASIPSPPSPGNYGHGGSYRSY